MKKTLLFIFSLGILFFVFSFKKENKFRVVVIKHTYELKVYDDLGWYATYPCVFGKDGSQDKMVAGDRQTPFGSYKIISKKLNSKWSRMMLLDYPTQADMDKFARRKADGLIPPSAKIGNGIGIHGTWPKESYTIDIMQNWTDGCIALKNEDVIELFNLLPVGTPITIEP